MSIERRSPYYFIAPLDVSDLRRADRRRAYRDGNSDELKKWSLEETAPEPLIALAESLGEEFLVWNFSYIQCRTLHTETLISPSPDEWLERATRAGQNHDFLESLRCIRRSRLSGIDWLDCDRSRADMIEISALLCLGEGHVERAREALARIAVPKDRIDKVHHFHFMAWAHAVLGQEIQLQEVMKWLLDSWGKINASLEWPETPLADPREHFTNEKAFAPYRTKPWFVNLLVQ